MVGKKNRIFLIIILLIVIISTSGYYAVFIYPKSHHRVIQNEEAITISAIDLVQAFSENESSANLKFLNKAIVIEDTILSVDKDQAGNLHAVLGSVNAFSNISVTFIDHPSLKIGQKVKIKGLCTGFLSDVIITDAKIN